MLKPGETVKGYIPAADKDGVKLIHWTEAARVGADKKPNPKVFAKGEEIPAHVFEDMQAGLPTVTRRTARERYQALVRTLLEQGRAAQAHGRLAWPESMQLVLDAEGFSRDNTDLHAQVYALAKHYIVKAENQQRAKDAKKVSLDFHGHYD